MIAALVGSGVVGDYKDSATIVPWWSFTKTVIAAAALALVRDGLVALDEFIPRQRYTLRQLLRHQAGLTDYGLLPDYHLAVSRGDEPWPEKEMLARADVNTLRYPPGEGWNYSNIGYLFLRHVIEEATGSNFDVALKTLVLHPFEAKETRLACSREDLAIVQTGELVGYDPRWVYHGLLIGPLCEAALLLHRLMTSSFLPPDLISDMREQIHLGGSRPGRPWDSVGYGLGLMIGTVDGKTVTGHSGVGPGSTIAVYHASGSTHALTGAAFNLGADEGAGEIEVLRMLGLPRS